MGLLKRYDSELRKEVTDNSDALFISTHRLKENKPLGDSGMLKIGFLKGVFGLELNESGDENDNEQSQNNTTQNLSIDDIDEKDIPF